MGHILQGLRGVHSAGRPSSQLELAPARKRQRKTNEPARADAQLPAFRPQPLLVVGMRTGNAAMPCHVPRPRGYLLLISTYYWPKCQKERKKRGARRAPPPLGGQWERNAVASPVHGHLFQGPARMHGSLSFSSLGLLVLGFLVHPAGQHLLRRLLCLSCPAK